MSATLSTSYKEAFKTVANLVASRKYLSNNLPAEAVVGAGFGAALKTLFVMHNAAAELTTSPLVPQLINSIAHHGRQIAEAAAAGGVATPVVCVVGTLLALPAVNAYKARQASAHPG